MNSCLISRWNRMAFNPCSAFHRVRPPPLLQSWLYQHWWSTFFYSSNGSFSDAICYGPMRCWSAVIPCYIFTWFSKFQWIVGVNDFWFVWRLQEFWQTSFRLMWRFCFAWIRLNPLSGKIVFHDSVPVIVSRFTSLIENFVICRYQVTKLFCTKWSFASSSSARSPRYFWFSSRHRNFGLLGSDYKYSASSISLPLS